MMLKRCLSPFRMNLSSRDVGCHDPLLWGIDSKEHTSGCFSMATLQANKVLEDQSQVISGSFGTFVGIFDGHGGPLVSRFVSDRIFFHVQNYASEDGDFSEEVLHRAFLAMEDDFIRYVSRAGEARPELSQSGSCCLVGFLTSKTLYVANVGDSKVILGSAKTRNKIKAEQLSKEHNVSVEEVRKELKSLHPDDSHIVVCRNGVWRVKGIIQVSRSIGDLYLKKPEFIKDTEYAPSGIPLVVRRPILTADPSIHVHELQHADQFLIFASDGLWELINEQEAVEIVNNSPRIGIARRLIRAALHEVSRKRGIKYADLRRIENGRRRIYHDDISVVVIYLDHDLARKRKTIPLTFSQSRMQLTAAPLNIYSDGQESASG